MKYIATMEFIGHHYIEFEAENDEEAKQMVENRDIPHPLEPNLYDQSVEECLPIDLIQEGGKDFIWQI